MTDQRYNEKNKYHWVIINMILFNIYVYVITQKYMKQYIVNTKFTNIKVPKYLYGSENETLPKVILLLLVQKSIYNYFVEFNS